MDALQALLSADLDVKKEVFIKRLDTHFTIQPLKRTQFDSLREQATHYVGKGKERHKEIDSQRFDALVIAKGCVSPDFSNAELKEKFGAVDAAEVVQKSLLAGETVTLQQEILKLSGFVDDEEELDEAKN
jgi:hypothetical protein